MVVHFKLQSIQSGFSYANHKAIIISAHGIAEVLLALICKQIKTFVDNAGIAET